MNLELFADSWATRERAFSQISLPRFQVYTLLSEKMNDAATKHVSNQAYQSMDKLYSNILASPGMIIVILVIISGFFAQQAMTFQDQIEDDVEIFLPDGAESTNLLADVREEWSTDIAIIYVQTDNARLEEDLVTISPQKSVLRQMSWVEGDDENADRSSTQRGIDWNKLTTAEKMEFYGLFLQHK